MATISNKLKCYLKKLIQALVTYKSSEDLFSKWRDEFLKEHDEKISEQNVKIEKLESIISIHENTMGQVLDKCVMITKSTVGGAVCVFMEWTLKRSKVKMMSRVPEKNVIPV